MKAKKIFVGLMAIFSGNVSQRDYAKKHFAPMALVSSNGSGFGNPSRGWRKQASRTAHREIARRRRRNA